MMGITGRSPAKVSIHLTPLSLSEIRKIRRRIKNEIWFIRLSASSAAFFLMLPFFLMAVEQLNGLAFGVSALPLVILYLVSNRIFENLFHWGHLRFGERYIETENRNYSVWQEDGGTRPINEGNYVYMKKLAERNEEVRQYMNKVESINRPLLACEMCFLCDWDRTRDTNKEAEGL